MVGDDGGSEGHVPRRQAVSFEGKKLEGESGYAFRQNNKNSETDVAETRVSQ